VEAAVAFARGDRRRSPAAVAAVAALGAAGVAYVALVDPNHPGPVALRCPFHAATGWWCPGCGMTRALHHVLHGQLGAAFASNLFWPVLVVILGWAWLSWARPATPPLSKVPGAVWIGFAALAVVFGVLRNLGPFGALAP
jgi:hypothetical protein